jgi:glutamate/aspartate transport system substrate-binding protein
MNRIRNAQALAASALVLLTCSAIEAGAAESTLEKIARTGELVLGYRDDSNPLSFRRANGEPAGYSVDFCRKVAEAVDAHFPDQDIEAKFVPTTSGRRIDAVVNGTIDIECGSTTITLSRQERVDFSLPTFVTGGSVLSLAASGIRDIPDLDGQRVAVISGTTTADQLGAHLDEHGIEAKIVTVADRNEGMNLLNEGEVEALASDQIVLIGQVLEARNPDRYAIISEIFSYEPYGLVVRRNDADFRLVVNRAIARLYRTGEQGEIFYDWIGKLGISVPPVVAAMYQLNALPE